jgi:hypothetical protein
MHALENLARLGVEPVLVEEEPQPAARLAADENVLRHGQMIHQLQFLMNDADAGGLRFARARERDRLAINEDFAGILRIDAGEDLHQRRFAGAVLAHQRMDFAGDQLEPDVVQRPDAGKALGQVPNGDQSGHGAWRVSPKRLSLALAGDGIRAPGRIGMIE